ncbi:target of Sbf [Hypoxylon texense]
MAKQIPLELAGPSEVPDVLAGVIIPIVFASLVVIGRLYSRLLLKNQWWDDAFILVAWLFAVAVVAIVGVETRFGLGHMFSNIPLRLRPVGIRLSYATISCYQVSLVLTKISILFFYLRILKLPYQRVLVLATAAAVALYGAVFFLLTFFLCNPVENRYEFDIRVGRCLRYYPVMTASAALHTATDLWLIALVLPHVLKMHLPTRQKVALAFVLTLGIFVACASLTRMAVAWEFLNPKYAQWDSFSFAIWTTLESSLGLVCASVPMLKPLVRQLMGRKPSSKPDTLRNVPRTKGQDRRIDRFNQFNSDATTLFTRQTRDGDGEGEAIDLGPVKSNQEVTKPTTEVAASEAPLATV